MADCGECGDDVCHSHPGTDGVIRCAKCQAERARKQNRDRNAKFRAQRPELRRSHLYRHKYGIDNDEYLRLLGQQDGLCAICRCPETTRDAKGEQRRLSVDHDHESGAVRGLLCHLCNAALGALDEDVTSMLNMIEYLLAG